MNGWRGQQAGEMRHGGPCQAHRHFQHTRGVAQQLDGAQLGPVEVLLLGGGIRSGAPALHLAGCTQWQEGGSE
jgi:hypothetical protein